MEQSSLKGTLHNKGNGFEGIVVGVLEAFNNLFSSYQGVKHREFERSRKTMSTWALATYIVFLTAIAIGIAECWRSDLPRSQKLFWTFAIIVFPIGGTILFWLLKDESKDLLS